MREFLRLEARTPFAYAAAGALAGLALLLSRGLQPGGSSILPLLILTAPVLASGILGGGGPALLAGALALLGADYFFVAPAGAFSWPSTPSEQAAAAAFGITVGLSVWLSRTARRVQMAHQRSETIAARLDDQVRRRELLRALQARAHAGGSLESICREAAAGITTALAVEHCAIFELTRDGDALAVSCAAGWNGEAASVEGLTIAAHVDTQTGYALHAREPVAIGDADADRRFTIQPALRERGVRSGIAAAIATAARRFGVVAAYSTSRRTYGPEDEDFVSSVAATLAGVYECRRLESERADLAVRDRAHRHAAELAAKRAAFLAQTAAMFDAALEPDATLVSLARLAVPQLADCAIVDLVHEDGCVRRVEVVDIDPTRRDLTHVIRRHAPDLRDEGPFSRAIRTGQPALLSEVPDPDAAAAEREPGRLMQALQCQSLLLIPLVARGQTLGLLTLASRDAARRYDAADLAVAQELSGRAAVALDNARLYRASQAANRTKDEFLATVSHELRTPINAVLGWAAMLRQHRLDASRVEYACDAIERSARAQAQLLEQLLDVSRAISGKLELRLAPAHLGAIIEAAIDAVRPDAEDKKVRIASRLDQTLPLMMVDPERLQQVVINLVSNAVKFSAEDRLVEIELRRDDECAELVVQDHGIGIKREFLPYVFERFRQADARRGSLNRGLGLGMSIARDIVERHGGTIAVESAGEGKGARFTVRLPLRSSPEAAMAQAPAAAAELAS